MSLDALGGRLETRGRSAPLERSVGEGEDGVEEEVGGEGSLADGEVGLERGQGDDEDEGRVRRDRARRRRRRERVLTLMTTFLPVAGSSRVGCWAHLRERAALMASMQAATKVPVMRTLRRGILSDSVAAVMAQMAETTWLARLSASWIETEV